jgi:hypothetical protein
MMAHHAKVILDMKRNEIERLEQALKEDADAA